MLKRQRVSSLCDFNSFPDGNLHSKVSFLKSALIDESSQDMQRKQRVMKLSYSIKNIGVYGEQIGIISKRFPLRFKQKVQTLTNPQMRYIKFESLPHSNFYANSLMACRKPINSKYNDENSSLLKSQMVEVNNTLIPDLMIKTERKNGYVNQYNQQCSVRQPIFSNQTKTKMRKTFHQNQTRNYSQQSFSVKNITGNLKRSSSLSFLKVGTNAIKSNNRNPEQKLPQQQPQNTLIKPKLFTDKKSYSKLLTQSHCQNQFKEMQMIPVDHEGNRLFKQINKIRLGYKETKSGQNFSNFRRTFSSSTVFPRRHSSSSAAAFSRAKFVTTEGIGKREQWTSGN